MSMLRRRDMLHGVSNVSVLTRIAGGYMHAPLCRLGNHRGHSAHLAVMAANAVGVSRMILEEVLYIAHLQRIFEMRYTGAVHAVVAEHASECPDEHFRLPHGLQMQHISQRNVLGAEVGVLAGHDLALRGTLAPNHVGRAALRRVAKFAAN